MEGRGESGRGRRDVLLVALGLFALALALRLFHLDHQSLWHDEAFTILAARKGWGGMVEDLVADFNHPPLHYVLVHLCFLLLDAGAFAARLPSALFGAAAVPVVFLLGRRLYDARTGLVAALLVTFSQQALVWSQTARGYAQLVFFGIAALHLFVVCLRERSLAAWIGAVVCATLALYTHFFAGFLVLACLAFLVLRRDRYRLPLSWMAGGVALAVLLFVPWLLSGVVEEARTGEATAFMEQNVWRRSSLRSIPDTVDAFNNGRVDGIYEDSPAWSVLVAGILFSVPALLALLPLLLPRSRDFPERESAQLLGLFVVLPVVLAWLLGYLGLAFRVRYVGFALPAYYLLVAHGLFSVQGERLRRVALVACLLYAVFAARAALFLPYRAEYRDGLASVAASWREGDALVFSPWGAPQQWNLYREDHPELVVREFREVADGGGDTRRVWLLTYLKPGARSRAFRNLERFEMSWSRVEQVSYYRLAVGLYERP
jgi:4-amino-4-deoxy-L-arabinose transferase-like glycosyltransferase